jgi:hypothetical protein
MQEVPKDMHSKLVVWFESAEDATIDSRQLSERDADYYDGKQLTQEEINTLKRRKQPPIVNNRIKPKVDFMLGQELKTRTDPKAFPRNPSVDEESANAATDALRYVCDTTKFERVRSLCYEDGLKYGTYGGQIVVKPKGDNDYTIEFVHVPWDRIFYDPHSRAKDFSDARYKGVVIWQDREDAEAMFPKGKDLIETTMTTPMGETYDDKPLNRWADRARDRVRVVYMEYLVGGVWHYCYMTKAGFLREPEVIPFVNDDGEAVPSLEFQSLFVDRDGNRYGQIRQYIDMQDEINKRRSKGLHLLNSRQTIGEKGAVDSVTKARQELARPDGYVEVNPGLKFEVMPTNDMAAGNWQMLQEAKGEIDAQGPNAALTGAEQRDLSGRAIQSLQSGSNVETAIQIDGLRDWEHRVYRLMWYCIKKYWTAEKWVRVTDDENSPRYVGLNVPSTVGEEFIKKARKEGQELAPEEMQMVMASPQGQQGVLTNNVAELDVDIILEDVPDTVTIQQEQFEQMTQLFPSMPPQLQPLAFEVLLQASSLRNKKQFIEKLQGKGEQPDPMQQQMQQMQIMMQQLEAKQKEADIAKTEADTILSVAKAEAAEIGQQLEQYKVFIESYNATTPQPDQQQNEQPSQMS